MSQDKKKSKPAKAETGVQEVNETEETETAQEQAPPESEVQADAQEDQSPEREATVKTDSENNPEPEPKKVPGRAAPGLKPVRAWIMAQRLAGWQSAALLRAMGWTEDKQVSEAEFNQALKSAMARPQGGSRRGR